MSHGDKIEKEPGSWMNTWRKKLIPSFLSHIGLRFGLFVCVYTRMWVFTYVCVYWCRFACVCGGQRSTLSLVCQKLSTVFGDQVCCLPGVQTGWARGCVGRPSSRALQSCVSPPPGAGVVSMCHCTSPSSTLLCGSGNQTQILTLTQQALYQLSHLPCPGAFL